MIDAISHGWRLVFKENHLGRGMSVLGVRNGRSWGKGGHRACMGCIRLNSGTLWQHVQSQAQRPPPPTQQPWGGGSGRPQQAACLLPACSSESLLCALLSPSPPPPAQQRQHMPYTCD